MAQASQEQGTTGTTDPEEDSPNMIVYRKVGPRWSLRFYCQKLALEQDGDLVDRPWNTHGSHSQDGTHAKVNDSRSRLV